MFDLFRPKKEKLSINSTEEEVSKFFSSNYKMTKKIKDNIIKESITGETLIYLEDNDYTFLGIDPDIKVKIKNYLEANKNQFNEIPINIILDNNSNINEVKKFCKEYLYFKGELSNDLNGQKIFKLTEQEMKNIGLNLGQRKKLLNYIKHVDKINYDKELKNFLKEKLKLTQQKIESLKLNGDDLFGFIKKEIGKLNIGPKQKKKYKDSLKKLKEKYNNSNTITKINADINEGTRTNTSTNTNINSNINNNQNININNNGNSTGNNNENNLTNTSKNEKSKIINKNFGKKDLTKYYTSLNNYKLQPLDGNSKYNLFFILIANEHNFNLSTLSIYSIDHSFFGYSNYYINYNFYLISEGRFSQNGEDLRYLMVQVPIKKNIQSINVTYSINNIYGYPKDYNTEIGINGINNYFYINNLKYENTLYYISPTLSNNEIFTYFLNFFFDKEKNKEEFLQKSLMKALINSVNNNQIKLSPEIILKYFKYCLNFKLDLKEINSIQIIEKRISKFQRNIIYQMKK